jgi:sugar phosphate isomerase/epimerase
MNTENVKAGHTLTLGYLCLADVGPLDIVLAAGRAGFQSVGVRLTARRPDESWSFESVNDRAARRVLARALADHGLSLSNVSSFHLYPEVTLEHLRPVIEASAELGASTLIACIYRDPDSALTDFLGEYAAEAEAAGLRIAIETVSYSACRTLSGARELLRQVGSPALGLMLDPLHLQRGGSSWTEVGELSSQEVCIAQLCDATRDPPVGIDPAAEARTMRRYPGAGDLPILGFLRALPTSAEIELEVPALQDRHLPPAERAALIRSRCVAYLQAHGISAG